MKGIKLNPNCLKSIWKTKQWYWLEKMEKSWKCNHLDLPDQRDWKGFPKSILHVTWSVQFCWFCCWLSTDYLDLFCNAKIWKVITGFYWSHLTKVIDALTLWMNERMCSVKQKSRQQQEMKNTIKATVERHRDMTVSSQSDQ